MVDKTMLLVESEETNFKTTLLKYLRNWYWFVITTVLCLIGAYLYLQYTTPEYMVSSTILIKDNNSERSSSKDVDLSATELIKYDKNIENELAVLKSRGLMQLVLDDLALNTSYYVEGQYINEEIYGDQLPVRVIVNKLLPSAYGQEISLYINNSNSFSLEDEFGVKTYNFGKSITTPYGTFTVVAAPKGYANNFEKIIVKFVDTEKMASWYASKLQVAVMNKNSSVIMLSITDPVQQKGIDVINKLIEFYNKEAIADKKATAANSLQFLDGRLKYLIRELTDVEGNVERYKMQYDVTDVNSEAQLYLEKSTDYNRQLSEWNAQLSVLQTIETYLTKDRNNTKLVPSSLNIQDATLQDLIKKYNELHMERETLLRTMQANHPLVQNINDQLGNLHSNILENLRNIKKGLQINRDNLQNNYAQVQSKKQLVPSIERELLEINRQQGTKEGLYLYLLQKREESALSLAANVNSTRLLDKAMASPNPVTPRKPLIYLLAFLAGMILPAAVVNIKGMLNDKVQHKADINALTKTPILGELSHNHTGEAFVVTSNNRSPVAELFRLVRANLQFAAVGNENKVMLVTSSMSGEGKTFFSLNIAASLVLTGKKVVVLEFDLRRPGLLKSVGLTSNYGISNYLISENPSIDDALIALDNMPGLYLVGAGPIPPNPSEMMIHHRVETLINELKTMFDYVVIDTAPIGQVADALALAPYIDSSIYIVRYNYTSKDQIQIIDDIYRNKKLKHPMLVLNDAKKQNGYGYGYGYGYSEEPETWSTKLRKKAKV
ncbi:GumC family protein [Pontibacter arcticus]|uniref:Capsular biosynthesis protein n=1 Tax=Pontibacter arcticus TaxID=2080288 RepID=A0A364RDP2_9BACT|nr:tyrosine-protein kinase family protein [Pontibacter arcticus]RAU82412.1 capsular biosynthesis protein [Pontibacter arcticus]